MKERIESTLNGTRKAEACDWWLRYIEEETNLYLEEKGFSLNALPYNYTTTPPNDLELVQSNLTLIKQMLDPHYVELDKYIDRVMAKVYSVLDELHNEMVFTLECDWGELSIDVTVTSQQREMLEKEIQYLRKLKAMDHSALQRRKQLRDQSTEEAAHPADGGNEQRESAFEDKEPTKRPLEITDVVPIQGLIMARFHILQCELQTSIDLWRRNWRRPTHNYFTRSFNELQ